MIHPFCCDQLFELNDNLEVVFNQDQQIVYVDNFFKNYEQICELTDDTMVARWKGTHPQSRNFIDYYDCRTVFGHNKGDEIQRQKFLKLMSLVEELLNKKLNMSQLNDTLVYVLSYFKHLKKNVDSQLNFIPHRDTGNLNLIVYLDTVCNGGTAFYNKVPEYGKEVTEEINVLMDVSNSDFQFFAKSVPNRAIIYDGNRPHGGYIDTHNTYYYNWRKTCVMFLACED